MKIYRITIDDLNNPEEGLMAISLVDFPAVETNFLKFKDDKRKRISLKADEEQHIITGVALLADTPIYRRDPEIGEYYIVFERDTIVELVQKYSQDGLMNVINLQHSDTTYSINRCTMIESYFVNHERGIIPAEFDNIPDGSWIVSFKVNDPELWKQIKDSNGEEGGLNGFSVEVIAGIAPKLKKEVKNEAGEDDMEKWMDELIELFVGGGEDEVETMVNECFSVTRGEAIDAMNAKKQLDVTTVKNGKEKTERMQIKDIGVKNGDVVINAYLPESDIWKTISISTIQSIAVTDVGLATWNYDLPSYEDITNDDEISVTHSTIASRENIMLCIEKQFFAMITYDDESEDHTPATGMRQVQVCAYGTTLAGNECFRAYEYFGDTAHDLPGGRGNWRMFLTKRCRSFHVMTEAKKWGAVPPGYRTGDVCMNTIYAEVIPGTINPYPDSAIKR